jgi:integrase
VRDVRIGSVPVAREVVTPGRRQRRQPRERTTLGFHAFRHTCASMLFAEGQNVKQVQRWLGHAKAPITLDTYPHLLDEGVGETLGIVPLAAVEKVA